MDRKKGRKYQKKMKISKNRENETKEDEEYRRRIKMKTKEV